MRELQLESGGTDLSVPCLILLWVETSSSPHTNQLVRLVLLGIFDHEHWFESDYVQLQYLLRFVCISKLWLKIKYCQYWFLISGHSRTCHLGRAEEDHVMPILISNWHHDHMPIHAFLNNVPVYSKSSRNSICNPRDIRSDIDDRLS